jgi:vacuolar-type H+-ATPase subunit H
MATKVRKGTKKATSKAKRPKASGAKGAGMVGMRASQKKFAAKLAKHSARIDNAEERLTQAVRKNVASALRGSNKSVNHWFDTAIGKTKEAMAAVRSASGDALASTRAVTRGVILGVSDAGGDSVASSRHVVRAAIDSAIDAGGDAAAVGRRAIQGAVDAAHTIGNDVSATARHSLEEGASTILAAGESTASALEGMIKTAQTRLKRASGKLNAKKKADKKAKKSVKKKPAAKPKATAKTRKKPAAKRSQPKTK